jgi:putative transposase
MPKRSPQGSGGIVFHVLNRGVRKMQLFDRLATTTTISTFSPTHSAARRSDAWLLLMPNHFHFVLWPHEDPDLSRFMFWLSTVHARRWHLARGRPATTRLSRRFKALPVCADAHFLRLCRYVERNPIRPDWSGGPKAGPGRVALSGSAVAAACC